MEYIKFEEAGIGRIEKSREDHTKQEKAEEKPMSPFEQMMLAKMDELMRILKEDYVELNECFESISKKLDGVDAMGAPHVDDI